jgi:hypothetical protein
MLLLLAGMITLGLLSNRPAPPPTLDDPQLLLQLYRQGHPVPLLDSLPLQPADQVRLFAEMPPEMKGTFFVLEPDGKLHTYPAPVIQRIGITGLMVDQVVYPAADQERLAVAAPAGTRLYLLCAHRKEAPPAALVQPLLGKEPWPEVPPLVLMQFSRTKVGPICSRGAKLPAPSETRQMEERLTALCHQLRDHVDFYVGVAVRVR